MKAVPEPETAMRAPDTREGKPGVWPAPSQEPERCPTGIAALAAFWVKVGGRVIAARADTER